MKKIIFLLIFVILISSFASAEMIITEQPKEFYNMGDIISMPLKIITTNEVNAFFSMYLICNGIETEIHKEYIGLKAGEEKEISASIPLMISFVGKSTGICKIKPMLGKEYILTKEFEISDLITIKSIFEESEFKPEQDIVIEGEAVKKNEEMVQGIVELKIMNKNSSLIEKIGTVKNGYFYLNFSLPKESKAGQYLVKIDVYEMDSDGQKTNKGFITHNILIKQIPTSLEIVFENSEIDPGTNLNVKSILHDQTGENIESNSIITIKNQKNEILEKTEKLTNDFLNFPIAYNEPPANWTVIAVSNELTAETIFKIKEKQDVKIELINKTLTITNMGNVPYKKLVKVKIGNETLDIDVFLDVDKTQKYFLTAPDGKYKIEIMTDEGNKINETITLTGKTVDVKEVSEGVVSLMRHPIVWIFIIAILGFITFLVFKKGRKRIFFGRTDSNKKGKEQKKFWLERKKTIALTKNSIVNTKNKAELSLSIQGNKQNASIVCLKIKNLKEIQSKKSNAEETLQKIVNIAEENKAVTYENQDNLFFILAPIKTRTFKNETTAVKIAQKTQKILKEYNKLAKQKIDFGISLNYGTIIAKQEKDILKFMSMGTLITTAKKISSISKEEIFLSEKIKDKLSTNIKTAKEQKDKIAVYTIKEIKDREGNKKFIRSFLNRIEGKK